MKFLSVLSGRLPWLNLAAGTLLVLLQRTPVVRSLIQAADSVLTSRAGDLLRGGFTVAALGALHGRAGATTYTQTPANPIRGTVGTPLSGAVAFTGAPSEAQNWSILSGSLPPGIVFIPGAVSGTIRARDVGFSGTPTQAGNFSVTLRANGVGGQSDPRTLMFEITGGANVAPAITTQPQSQSVSVGANVTLSVAASGSPPPTFQWTKNGTNISGATTATLTLANVQADAAGSYAVIVTNSAGSLTSNAATVVVMVPGGVAPQITTQPIGFTAGIGGTAALGVVASGNGNSYQWRKDGTPISKGTDATLMLTGVTPADAGTYSVTVTNGGGTTTSDAVTVGVAAGEARLANLSVRANLATSQRLIVGFATNGEKSVLLRGIGPTLGSFGVAGAFSDPRLELFNDSTKITENDDWVASLAPVFSSVGAFALTNGSKDAAMQIAVTGSRTAQLSGTGSGVVLVEVYDAAVSATRLVNVSARNFVGTGENILIAGFVVGGTVGKTLLIRAVGPTLGQAPFNLPGTLVDPKLEIYNGAAIPVKVAENDNWSTAMSSIFGSVGAFTLNSGSRDAALLVTLMPGAYSAQVSGISNGTGEALVEVYEVP